MVLKECLLGLEGTGWRELLIQKRRWGSRHGIQWKELTVTCPHLLYPPHAVLFLIAHVDFALGNRRSILVAVMVRNQSRCFLGKGLWHSPVRLWVSGDPEACAE